MGTTRRGITFIDLIATITLLICLVPLAVSVVNGSRGMANGVRCATNLKQIGQAILLYANDNGNSYPRTRYRAETADAPTAWSGANSTAPFALDGAAVNDVTAAYRLLLATQDLVPEVFICPSSGVGDPAFARARYKPLHANFLDERETQLQLRQPVPDTGGAGRRLHARFSFERRLRGRGGHQPRRRAALSDVTAVAADDTVRNLRRGNSPNHERDGQNVLYGDGHVEFQQSPFVGVDRDNIFTFGRREKPAERYGVFGPPTHAADSVLLPTANAVFWRDHPYRSPASSGGSWTVAVGGLILTAALVAAWRLRRRGWSLAPLPSP